MLVLRAMGVSIQETVYRCKKCRRLVATESNTIPVPDQAPCHNAAWRYQASRAKGLPTSWTLPSLSCWCLAFAHGPLCVLPESCGCLSSPSESLDEHSCDLVGTMGLAACNVQRREKTLARWGHRCLWSRCSGCSRSWTMAMCRASSIALGEQHPVLHTRATPCAAQAVLLST